MTTVSRRLRPMPLLLRVFAVLLLAVAVSLTPVYQDMVVAMQPARAYAETTHDAPRTGASIEANPPDGESADGDAGVDDIESDAVAAPLEGIAEGKADGTYYGSAEGYQSTITVAATVSGGSLAKVKVVSHADDQTYLEHAEKVIPRLIDAQSIEVDAVSGATYSSQGIIDAVEDAMVGSGTVSATNSPWFGFAMVAFAAALAAAGAWCVRWYRHARARADKMRALRVQQLALQGMFFVLAPASFASGFMGAKSLAMQMQVMQTQRGYEFQIASFTILLIGLLAFTVVFGRFFCGYACAFGFMGDALYNLASAVCNKLHIERRPFPRKLETVLRGLKYVVLGVVCGMIFAGLTALVNNSSPWTAFSSLMNLSVRHITGVSAVLLGLIVVGMVTKERFFCEFLCPLGALFSLLPTLPTGKMRRRRPRCVKGCEACRQHCPVNIEPKGGVLAGECLSCGRCAQVCPVSNVVLGLEVRADQQEQDPQPRGFSRVRRVLASRPVAALIKAGLLLVLLWLMKATRFLPMPFD